jgi:Subtilisin inhibitor-like
MGRTCKGTVSSICLVALIGCFTALMTACAPWSGTSKTESATTTTATARPIDLTITVQPRGQGGPTRTWTLRCNPPGGSLPRAATACARLRAEALRPLPPGTICTQIYGGPQTARVRGRVDGRPVDSRFGRSNGCEIHRWDELRYLLAPG